MRTDVAKRAAQAIVIVGLIAGWPGPQIASVLASWAGMVPGRDAGVRTAAPLPSSSSDGSPGAWFQEVRPHCNAVEAGVHLRSNPAPSGVEGTGYAAACLALAGHIDEARALIDGLDGEDRWQAAGVVFQVGHPAADAGDDVAAGPLMELVVDYWPNHYMALYHAGAWRYQGGDMERARVHLERFLEAYGPEDGWTRNARTMLERIEG